MFKSTNVRRTKLDRMAKYQDESYRLSLKQANPGEYQQKHPALQLDIIQSLIPANLPLADWKIPTRIKCRFNDLLQYRQLNEYGKHCWNNPFC
jgi:hypothetical protein